MPHYTTRVCPVCGESYQADVNRLKHGRQTTCSRECSYKLRAENLKQPKAPYSRHGKVIKPCLNCGAEFEGTQYTKYCSSECRGEQQYKRVTLSCHRCGKDYEVQAYRAETSKYCSRDCMWPEHIVTCDHCGKGFKRSPSGIEDHNFCSRECLFKWQIGRNTGMRDPIDVECPTCGKEFQIVRWQLNRSGRKFCSRECFAVAHSSAMAGESNPAWRGGFEPYYGPNWKVERELVLERDNYTCQLCGVTQDELGESLHVHHIEPLREFDRNFDQSNRPDNLISLCSSCHKKVEWQGGTL